jgi:hypothetical protein
MAAAAAAAAMSAALSAQGAAAVVPPRLLSEELKTVRLQNRGEVGVFQIESGFNDDVGE